MITKNKASSLYQYKGYWYFYCYDNEGRRRKFSTGTKDKTEAEIFLKKWLKCPIIPKRKLSVKECIKPYTSIETNPKMVQSKITGGLYSIAHARMMTLKASRLLEEIPNKYLIKPVKDLTRVDCIEIRKIIWENHGSTSISYNVWRAFKTILSFASKTGEMLQSPAAGLEDIAYERKERMALPYEDIKTIMESDIFLSDEYKAFFIVLATTGMRRGEAAALCTSQIKEVRGIRQICINRARKDYSWITIGLPKMNIIRTIPIADVTFEAIRPFLNPEKSQDLIFPNITPQGITTCFNRIKAIAPEELDLLEPDAVMAISPHILRHSLNTALILSNVNNILVQEYLSWHHQDLGTQQGYTHIYARNLMPVAKMIDVMYGKGNPQEEETPWGNKRIVYR